LWERDGCSRSVGELWGETYLVVEGVKEQPGPGRCTLVVAWQLTSGWSMIGDLSARYHNLYDTWYWQANTFTCDLIGAEFDEGVRNGEMGCKHR
jgi:hypothetical protein